MDLYENYFRALVEHSPEAIFIGAQGYFVYVNPATVRLLGASSAEQLLGKNVVDFVHPDYRHAVADRMQRIFEAKSNTPPLDEKFLRLDGTVIDVEVSAVAFNFNGENTGLVYVRNITSTQKTSFVLRLNGMRTC